MTDESTEWRSGHELSHWPDLKFARAQQLLAEFQNRLLVWSKSTMVKTTKKISDDRQTLEVIVDLPSPPPLPEIALLLGDALHNARASLDALIWDLAHQGTNAPENVKRIQFPICMTEANWRAAQRDLLSVPALALERVRSVQPFHNDPPESSALYLLHELDIRDKHRSSLECAFHIENFSLNNAAIKLEDDTADDDSEPPIRLDYLNDGPLHDGDVVLRITSPHRMEAAVVPSEMTWRLFVAFDSNRVDFQSCVNTIMQSVHGVQEIVRYGADGAERRADRMAAAAAAAQSGGAAPLEPNHDALLDTENIEWDVDLRRPS